MTKLSVEVESDAWLLGLGVKTGVVRKDGREEFINKRIEWNKFYF